METQKLYETDSHRRTCTARVTGCEPAPDGTYRVTLNRTVFYPEGGGQPWDTGTLGGAAVTAVRERDGQVFHTCSAPLEVGATVEAEIDWARRLDLTQQHSGEHIVSGLVHRAFGYDNVGFHLGKDTVTIDFNGPLEEAQLEDLERRANQVVWDNLPVRVFFLSEDRHEALDYRSKKALTGRVRLVEYPGVDLCACCGTHVAQTGEIGLIRLLGAVRFRGGVRMEMVCGGRALAYDRAVWAQNHRVSNLLSAKPLETAAAVERAQEELARAKYRLVQLENRRFAGLARQLAGAGDTLLFEEGLEPDGVRRLAVAVGEACGGLAAVFSGEDGDYKYALSLPGGDLRDLSRRLNEALHGRGGGKPPFVQGSVRAAEAEIRAFFDAHRER